MQCGRGFKVTQEGQGKTAVLPHLQRIREMQQLSGSHTRTLKALGEISTDDSRDTKGDRPVLTGGEWLGKTIQGRSRAARLSVEAALSFWDQAVSVGWELLSSNEKSPRRAPEGHQMTPAELPERCLYRSSL